MIVCSGLCRHLHRGSENSLSSPEPLSDHHQIDDFHSGVPLLDDWLKRRARVNHITGASRTYVACEFVQVIGYYALASGVIIPENATGRFRRNMPSPIPVAILGRLAIYRDYQGRGIGRACFRDAALRIANAADAIGIRGIIVHAISEEARRYYLALGFDPSPHEPMTLMVTLSDIRAAFK